MAEVDITGPGKMNELRQWVALRMTLRKEELKAQERKLEKKTVNKPTLK
jgi:hypothetical protein